MALSNSDPDPARDVAGWRKAERERLIADRLQRPANDRKQWTDAIVVALDALVPPTPGMIVSVYWPIRGEPDLRPWMQTLMARGVRVALPVALAPRQRLEFREWRPNAPLARGLWKIPYPAEGAEVVPTVMIAPLVGFDPACYRLGYGGGFFDRTLAALRTRPMAIGVGYSIAALATIYPQPHDIPMNRIVTEKLTPS